MNTKLSLFLSIGLLGLSAGIGPVLMAEHAQALSEPTASESQDLIKQSTEPQGCIWMGRWLCA
jgi:hypothetical protein